MAKKPELADEEFEKSDFKPGRATYDYQLLLEDVLSGGGDVFICNLRENQLRRMGDTCPHCGGWLDSRRTYTVCPVCRNGIVGHALERKRPGKVKQAPTRETITK